MSKANRLALVTGAAGFLGGHVAARLAADGWTVGGVGHGALTSASRRSRGLSFWVDADVTAETAMYAIEQLGQPKLVFHAAGGASVGASYADPEGDRRRMIEPTAGIIAALRVMAPDAVLVYPSSAAVYGDAGPMAIPETAVAAPVSPYGVHKVMAEEMCMEAARNRDIRCAIVRYFSLYGPGLRKQILWDIASLLIGDPDFLALAGTGRETRDFLFVDDAVDLALAAAGAVNGEPILVNGGTGTGITVSELAAHYVAALRLRPEIRFTGETRPGDPMHLVADTKAARDLRFAPRTDLGVGLRAYTDWLDSIGSALFAGPRVRENSLG